MIAAGIGCRRHCPVDQVLRALEQSLAEVGRGLEDVQALYTADFKHGEPGLVQAAALLKKQLLPLPLEDLRARASGALTRSAHTLARFGLPSVAETAALAGAARLGPADRQPRLLCARHISGSASCALAIPGDASEGPA